MYDERIFLILNFTKLAHTWVFSGKSHGKEKISDFLSKNVQNYTYVQFTDVEPPDNADDMGSGVAFLRSDLEGEYKYMTFLDFFHE